MLRHGEKFTGVNCFLCTLANLNECQSMKPTSITLGRFTHLSRAGACEFHRKRGCTMLPFSQNIYEFLKQYPFTFSVIQAEWMPLLFSGFILGFIYSVGEKLLESLSLLGISSQLIDRTKEKNKSKEGKSLPLSWTQKANLDSPPRGIYAKRYTFRCLTLFFRGLFAVIGFTYCAILIGFLLVNPEVTQQLLLGEQRFYPLGWLIGGVFAGAIIGSFFSFLFLSRWLNKKGAEVNQAVVSSRSQHKGRTGELSDARSLQFSTSKAFNPVRYFDEAVQKDAVFLGLDDTQQPIFVPRKQWMKTNIQIMGAVGSGKGVLACSALAQCLSRYNDAVIVFDPKNDEFAPHVLKSQSSKFVLINLNQGQPAQLNLFSGLTSYQLNELLVSGFSLGRRGDNADYYRDNDRKAVRMLSEQFASGTDVAGLLDAAQNLPQKVKESASGFMNLLQELCSLSVLQTREGVDLSDIILNGGCLYIIGSLRDESVIMLQKMLFVRCIQIIEARNRFESTTHVNIMLDEFKYLLSKSSLDALGTVRDKNCNVLLTHQSLGDFGQCGSDIKPEAASSTVIDNTPIKWIYRMKDYKAAEWTSKQTGQILVDSERRNVSTDRGNIELMSTESSIIKEKRELIDTNAVQHLPDGAAVMIGVGLARIAYSQPIAVKPSEIALKAYPKIVLPTLDIPAHPMPSASSDETSLNPAEKSAPIQSTNDDGWR